MLRSLLSWFRLRSFWLQLDELGDVGARPDQVLGHDLHGAHLALLRVPRSTSRDGELSFRRSLLDVRDELRLLLLEVRALAVQLAHGPATGPSSTRPLRPRTRIGRAARRVSIFLRLDRFRAGRRLVISRLFLRSTSLSGTLRPQALPIF